MWATPRAAQAPDGLAHICIEHMRARSGPGVERGNLSGQKSRDELRWRDWLRLVSSAAQRVEVCVVRHQEIRLCRDGPIGKLVVIRIGCDEVKVKRRFDLAHVAVELRGKVKHGGEPLPPRRAGAGGHDFLVFEQDRRAHRDGEENMTHPLACILTSLLIATGSLSAATPEQEKAFVAAYKKAFEAKDEKTLQSFLYSKGVDPKMLQDFNTLLKGGMGAKIKMIALVALTPEDPKTADRVIIPDGMKASKKLAIEIEGGSVAIFVAEKDGRFIIPVPTGIRGEATTVAKSGAVEAAWTHDGATIRAGL